jgi:putative phosphoesterase
MRVGLLSDSHDRLPAVAELVRQLTASGAQMFLHAGDYCAPFALSPLLEAQAAVAGVFGRNDGDREGLRAFATRGVGIEIYESPHSFELAGRRILLVHELAEVHVRSLDAHEIVVHGCTHRQEVRDRGTTLIVNPGEACGWLHGVPSAAILDTETRQVEFLTLTGPEWQH